MKKLTLVLIALVSLLIPLHVGASGILLDAEGKVAITIAGKSSVNAVSGLELPDGSVIDVGNGAKASVLLESGAVDEIASKTKYTVGATKASSKRTDFGNGITLAMRELAASGEGAAVHGMVKKAEGPKDMHINFGALGGTGFRGTYPVDTTVRLKNNIEFRWSRPVDYSNPLIIIDDAQKRHLSESPIKAGASLILTSPGALRLTKGNVYSWYLATKEGESIRGKTTRYKFTTLSAADEKTLDIDIAKVNALSMSSAGKDLLVAQFYFQRGLIDDMVKTLLPLYQKQPSPFVKQLLFLGYSRMGNVEEMEKYR
ncbi:MAG: hypothetical protein ABH871_02010 [Pseudomonadota bacterium]